MEITGQCHCGELKFTARVNPEKTLICHCSDCQRLSASAFRTAVMSELNGLTFTQGQPKEYIKIAESGNHRAQGFCQNCGTGIYATSVSDEPKVYAIRVGAVDQSAALVPVFQIFCRSAQSWVNDIGAIKSFADGPQ
ncbi:Glutathione-dependent formaldehyde-activating, GFA [Oleispira antarctica RB-8]|uniref:Glutathione-dependent formaldehyde-activating, GFA n=1 Tax=Oleispira antarctica RB-8 TaxID=698738 RepID=R4YTP2_OLEAN|nr:Glutathione-dependent formaldehyde-activating, GFA [Oleispira antarctica RB-8]